MLCEALNDSEGLEADMPSFETGFGFIADTVTYQQPKILKRGVYSVFGFDVTGYEIHCGKLARYPLFYDVENISGTHIHGIFDNNKFRSAYFKKLNPAYKGFDYTVYREETINAFTNMVRENLDLTTLYSRNQCIYCNPIY